MYVDIGRARINTPDGTIPQGRFIFLNDRAAVWVENKQDRSARRVFLATGATFEKAPTARQPHLLHLSTGETVEIFASSRGCGCSSPLKHHDANTLLSDDFDSVG